MIYLFISTPEVVVILFVVVLLFGTDKIPELARGIAKGIRMVKDTTNDIKHEITKSATDVDMIDTAQSLQKEVNEMKENLSNITGSVGRKK